MIQGIFCSLLASILFAGLYYLATYLRPLSGVDVFGFRMLVSLPFMGLAIILLKQQKEFLAFLQRLYHQPQLILVLLFTAALVGVQMWLFLWAPNAGRAIDVSVGYLLMPLSMALIGRFVYRETLSPYKWLAIGFATAGVFSNIWLSGKFSWASTLVFIGYPFYFMVRRYFNFSHIHSFVLEIALLVPVACYFVSQIDMPHIEIQNPNIYFFLFLLGLLSGIALISYTLASSLIPFNLLGLLGYIEPCGMLLISFLIGETLSPDAYGLMACLSVAITLVLFDGLVALHRSNRQKRKNSLC